MIGTVLGYACAWLFGGFVVAIIVGKIMCVGAEPSGELLDPEIYEGSAGRSDASFPVGASQVGMARFHAEDSYL